MRSGDGSGRLAWLRSQGLGVACGLATVVLLAVGSVVIAATRDGASAAVGMDDLRGFFSPPRLAHAWLYLLFPVAGLYAVNTVLATWDTVSRRWRAGVRSPSAYGPSVVHVAFLLGLVAHAAGGFLGADHGEVLVASGWRDLPGFGEVRLVSLEVDAMPNGMPRAARARLELRDASGRLHEDTVGYNEPLSAGGGARLALLSDLGDVWVVRLSSDAESCALAQGQECRLAGELVRLVRLAPLPGGAPAAAIRLRGPSGAGEVRWIADGAEAPLPGGRVLRLAGVSREPAVLLRAREAPGNPWALAASIALAAGAALMWRKLAR
jgi:hypothetical protein